MQSTLAFSVLQGPNFIWHIDQHDKLTPFGFPIHGAMDGYSRHILWCKIVPSNRDAWAMAHLYMETVRRVGKVPVLMYIDPGTENKRMAELQVSRH